MAERDDASDLLDVFAGYSPAPKDARVIKIAVVQSATTSYCRLLFDGETSTGAKWYPTLKSYAPSIGDRVIVLPVGSRTSWIVLGAISPGP
jgi:hypothetical protein